MTDRTFATLRTTPAHVAAILAGLRLLQCHALDGYPSPECLDVFSDGRERPEPMTADDIGALCAFIETSTAPGAHDQETVLTMVADLKEGDRLDLYGDVYADPDRDPMNGYEFEFEVVTGVTVREALGAVEVETEGNSFAFPIKHAVPVNVES